MDNQQSSPRMVINIILGILSGACMSAGLYMAFYYAPLLRHNGLPWWSQKIFYIHLPAAWGGLSGLLLVLIGSIAYLKTRNEKWDAFAVAAAEVCFLYATMVLLTGPLWARPSWNTFWKWEDPRLMSFLALFLILGAYQLQRIYGAPGHPKRLASAALGIVGALSVPFVYYSVKLGRSLHPMLETKEIDPRVRLTLWVFLFAFFFLFVLIMRIRKRMEEQQNRTEELLLLVPDEEPA